MKKIQLSQKILPILPLIKKVSLLASFSMVILAFCLLSCAKNNPNAGGGGNTNVLTSNQYVTTPTSFSVNILSSIRGVIYWALYNNSATPTPQDIVDAEVGANGVVEKQEMPINVFPNQEMTISASNLNPGSLYTLYVMIRSLSTGETIEMLPIPVNTIGITSIGISEIQFMKSTDSITATINANSNGNLFWILFDTFPLPEALSNASDFINSVIDSSSSYGVDRGNVSIESGGNVINISSLPSGTEYFFYYVTQKEGLTSGPDYFSISTYPHIAIDGVEVIAYSRISASIQVNTSISNGKLFWVLLNESTLRPSASFIIEATSSSYGVKAHGNDISIMSRSTAISISNLDPGTNYYFHAVAREYGVNSMVLTRPLMTAPPISIMPLPEFSATAVNGSISVTTINNDGNGRLYWVLVRDNHSNHNANNNPLTLSTNAGDANYGEARG